MQPQNKLIAILIAILTPMVVLATIFDLSKLDTMTRTISSIGLVAIILWISLYCNKQKTNHPFVKPP